jgi:hypothetical protein
MTTTTMKTVKIISFGGGVDSSALLAINLKRDEAAAAIGISREQLDEAFPIQDAAMFSHTGRERKQTYPNIDKFEQAYRDAGIPFFRVQRDGEDIVEWMMRLGTLPLMPGSSHLCSLKFKTEVTHGNAEKLFPNAKIEWSIGIEANEDRRANKSFTVRDDDKHVSVYPLRNLGLDRAACIAIIAKLGFGFVVKSSCPFCPFMQEHEIADVINNDKESWEIVKAIEDNFKATSPIKHGAWLAAGKPLNKGGKAPKGMWRKDSHAEGARLYAKKVDGRQLSVHEWEARLRKPVVNSSIAAWEAFAA